MDFDDLDDKEQEAAGKEGQGAAGGAGAGAEGGAKAEFDPYGLLGVPPDATDADIKSAFRKASLKVHPDRCPDDPRAAEKFRELAAAKDFLLNPFARRLYNVKHGLLKEQESPIWWTDWDTIFAEIEADQGDELEGAPEGLPRSLEQQPQVDILIYGATGITGTLACMLLRRGLWKRTWAIAGRDGRKLGLLESKFGGGPYFRGATRAESPEAIEQAVRSARVVVDLSGPSHLVGTAVAEACVRAGRHYVDNTGDVKFSRLLRDKLHDRAKAAGVCMVLHTGYCSLPVDFCAWYMVKYLREKYNVPTRRITAFDRTAGFVLSGTNYVQGQTFGGENTKGWDMFLLGGVRPGGVREEDQDPNRPVFQELSGIWGIQAAVADRIIVRGTCGLMEGIEPYGKNFHYSNWVPFPDEDSAAQAIMMTRFVNPKSLERLAQAKKIPPVGSGPGERMRQECYCTRVTVAEADEKRAKPRQAYCMMNAGPGGFGDRYEGTAAMSIEAACAILDAEDNGHTESLRKGWGTPVYHLAHLGFWERLIARGASFRISDGPPSPDLFKNMLTAAMPIQC